jgi:hypothetical protein
MYEEGLVSPWLYKEDNKLRVWKKNVFTLHIPPPELHTFIIIIIIIIYF